jgi:protocatechuate 3,4-dioxygenase beta subunit
MATVVIADTDDRRYEIPHASTNARGEYEIPGVPPGVYRVVAFYSDEATQRYNIKVVAGKRTALTFDVVMSGDARAAPEHDHTGGTHAGSKDLGYGRVNHRATGSIEGMIVDADTGEPVPGAVVSATMPRLRNAIHALAGADGKYRFVGIRPGVYTLSVYYTLIDRGNIEFRRAGVKVLPGKVARIQLRLDTKTAE